MLTVAVFLKDLIKKLCPVFLKSEKPSIDVLRLCFDCAYAANGYVGMMSPSSLDFVFRNGVEQELAHITLKLNASIERDAVHQTVLLATNETLRTVRSTEPLSVALAAGSIEYLNLVPEG
ncbi:hypothetical protein [uncultured Roseibium sp.]|uniref:hypothetical protein n=1 Tax=uncultured Roseibium sp. TaxID=1936171 RepID=UPI00261347E6|nr:hypothetical protein [uncultured Roseibium sp.]